MAEPTPPVERPRRPGRPRARPRAERAHGDVRAEILAAAMELFAARGVEAVTMAEVAESVGLQQPSLYYYFRSKADILARLVGDANRVPRELAAQARAGDGPVAVRLFRLLHEDVKALCHLPFDINEVHRLSARHADEFERYWADRQALNDDVEALVAQGIETGEFREVDARLAALSLLANDEATQHWFRPVGGRRLRGRDDPALGDYSVAEIADATAEAALRHLLSRPANLEAVRSRALASDS